MTRFRVKLDENLARSHVEMLRARGYDADRVHEEGLSGYADENLWPIVVREGRFFVTLDLDFSDIRRFEPGSHPGLLLLRQERKGRVAVAAVLRRVLDEGHLEDLRGCLAVADPERTRIRRPQ
jgi:predicted nuclease of predicted toxin-antitoxin system